MRVVRPGGSEESDVQEEHPLVGAVPRRPARVASGELMVEVNILSRSSESSSYAGLPAFALGEFRLSATTRPCASPIAPWCQANPARANAGVAGALFGLIANATCDLGNVATLKNRPLYLNLIDIAWGTLASALATLARRRALGSGWLVLSFIRSPFPIGPPTCGKHTLNHAPRSRLPGERLPGSDVDMTQDVLVVNGPPFLTPARASGISLTFPHDLRP